MNTYTIFSDGEVNFPLGIIDEQGNLLSGVDALDIIFANVKKGSASDKANNLLCVLNIEHPKEKDVVTLGELMGRPSKPKDESRVSVLLRRELDKYTVDRNEAIDEMEAPEIEEAKIKDLPRRVIKSGNRYMSKVDWSSDRVKNQIQGRLDHGESLSYIAKCFGVARSTLTMANKRYHLYAPDLRKAS